MSRFQILDAYLARLPAGLDSYPEYVGKASIAPRQLRRQRGDAGPGLLALEVLCDNDAARFEQWSWDVNRALLAQPLYRAVFGLLGARLTVRAIGAAWSTFHRGVTQDVEVAGTSGTITLTGAPWLMPPELAPSYATAYRAGLAVAGIASSRSEVLTVTSTSMRLRVSWG
jgi:hypothetical protein